jgi:hypothetical protein
MSEQGSDRRSVATDALETLGMRIGPEQKRDAIHLAVEPVIAGEWLNPAAHITIRDGKAYNTEIGKGLGIVDPFLTTPVATGERFWFVMYPRMVHSLRHVWTHPAFPDEVITQKGPPTKEESEAWLRNFIANADCPSYEIVMAAAVGDPLPDMEYYGKAYRNDGEYLYFAGRDAHGEIPPEFWDHVENVTGKKIVNRPEWFSCSC